MLVPAQAAVQQAQANTQDDADNIRDPVVEVGAAVEAGLDELNGAAKRARAYEDRQQSEAPRARQREGQRSKGDEVHELVAALGCCGGASRGQSIATLRASVTIMVRGISRYLRMQLA